MKTDLLDAAESTALAPMEPAGVTMFERLASDPNVPVEKLERLIAMQERIMANNAKAEFDAAYAEMQGEIPIITERGQILVNGQLRSKYAKLEDILEVVKPIMQAHGFAIRHQSEFKDGMVKITGILSHRAGHSERDEFVAKADTSGSKNDIQALGSTRSYGQRYTTIALLNIATSGEDDDGHGSVKMGQRTVATPAGYGEWWDDIQAVADEGYGPFATAWNNSKQEHRAHAMNVSKDALSALKLKAKAIDTRAKS